MPKNALHVNVTAQQFTWTFTYTDGPAKGITSPDLYMPIDRATELEITSVDVLHSFWVPQFGQKQDAVPGRINPLMITPTKIGTYPVICTELCGLGHALMRRQAIVMSATDFAAKKWATGCRERRRAEPPARRRRPARPDRPARRPGRRSSSANGCGSCHTLTAAGTNGHGRP